MKDISQKQLHRLIDDYFDARTDEADEELLRRMLATTRHRSPAIDEARAVMGIFAASRNSRRQLRRARHMPLTLRAGAAAAVAALCLWGAVVMTQHRTMADDSVIVAYHDGQTLDDPAAVIDVVNRDLALLAEASSELGAAVGADMADIADMLGGENTTGHTSLNYIVL